MRDERTPATTGVDDRGVAAVAVDRDTPSASHDVADPPRPATGVAGSPAPTSRRSQHRHVYPTPPDMEASNPPWRWVVTTSDGSWRADGWTLTRLGALWAAWRAERRGRRRSDVRAPASRRAAWPHTPNEPTPDVDDDGTVTHAA